MQVTGRQRRVVQSQAEGFPCGELMRELEILKRNSAMSMNPSKASMQTTRRTVNPVKCLASVKSVVFGRCALAQAGTS